MSGGKGTKEENEEEKEGGEEGKEMTKGRWEGEREGGRKQRREGRREGNNSIHDQPKRGYSNTYNAQTSTTPKGVVLQLCKIGTHQAQSIC